MTDDLQDRDTPDTRIESDDPRLNDDDPRGGLPQADETRKADDLEPAGRDAPAGAPTGRPDWTGEEWSGETRAGRSPADETTRGRVEDDVTGGPKWNEHEFVGEGQGGPDEGPTERVMPTEGDNEFSGHGHNPGGGERWADVDRGLPAEPADDTSARLER